MDNSRLVFLDLCSGFGVRGVLIWANPDSTLFWVLNYLTHNSSSDTFRLN